MKNSEKAMTKKHSFGYEMGKIKENIKQHYVLYLFALPAVIFVLVFSYAPMYGIQVAFKEYNGALGIWKSPWVGFDHFTRFFKSIQFSQTMKNTIVMSLYCMFVGYPVAIITALLLNALKSEKLRKTFQMVSYIPHFISTVVMAGLLLIYLDYPTGMINNIISAFGLEPYNFFGEEGAFSHIYVWSHVWQETGWGTILYISTLASVDPQLHEAAIIDGANRLRRMWHIDLPAIANMIVVLLIMECGHILSVGFEKVYLLQNPLNLLTSETIQTYVYKIGIGGGEFSFAAAVGLFQSIVSLILTLIVNKIANRVGDMGLW